MNADDVRDFTISDLYIIVSTVLCFVINIVLWWLIAGIDCSEK